MMNHSMAFFMTSQWVRIVILLQSISPYDSILICRIIEGIAFYAGS